MLKRPTHILYTACAITLLFLFYLSVVGMKDDIFEARTNTGYRCATDYTANTVEDSLMPLGVKTEYILKLNALPKGEQTLMFYTIHQNVEVYMDGICIYHMYPDSNNLFGTTPGNNWNTIPIYEEDQGKELKIVIIPVYESSLEIVPDFYLGSTLSIWEHLIKKNIATFALSLLAACLGLLFSIFILVNYRNSEVDKSLLMMGLFSLNIGIWKIADLDSTALLFPHSIALTYVPFFALLLVVIPFVLYVKELFSNRESIVWYLPCFASIAVTFLSVVLQLAHVADFRQTLWMNHAVMGSVFIVSVGMILHELLTVGWNRRLKITILCISACLLGLVADILIYYISQGTSATVLGMLGFTVYILVLGIMSLRDARRLMAIGMQAKRFEQMAYHDQLTGLYNRTAYAEYTAHTNFSPKNCIVIMCDLNNLKQCNDTLGHEMGDRYIMESAHLIQQVFAPLGKCYRMGGDEFCVLLNNISMDDCIAHVKKLQEEVDRYNQAHPEAFRFQIACGFKAYDAATDYDLSDTLRRADKMMYHEKFVMKQKVSLSHTKTPATEQSHEQDTFPFTP